MKVNRNNCSKYMHTSETTDYDKFIIPRHQREQKESSIKGIMDSISTYGVISAISCRKSKSYNGKLEVYNGQHTLQACKRLGVPVVYNTFEDVSNKVIMAVHGTSKSWGMEDYLKYGVEDKIDGYLFLDRKYKEEKIPLTGLILMYGGAYGNKAFKSLEWKALTVERGDRVLSYINDFSSKFNIKHSRYARFIWGLCKIVDTGLYDHERMMRQMSKCSQLMTKQANPEGYTKNIEDIYNYGLTAKNKVQFVQ